ncbi:hypothetical protein [Haloarchaeobius amylolyticus]|uniref:hypothetical protein n=1 Tax=Haloarchaeobius amylolyticus TaxID=1198296 RepID=UPI00226DF11B|nr:hypothetical protein [Haloarchaeobius amylolyticus]
MAGLPSMCPNCGNNWAESKWTNMVTEDVGHAKMGGGEVQCEDCKAIIDLETREIKEFD